MAEYVLRNIEPTVWASFTSRANQEGWPTKALIVALMHGYGRGEIQPAEPPPIKMPEYAWLRSHFRKAAAAPGFSALDPESKWQCLIDQILESSVAGTWNDAAAVPADRRGRILRWLEKTSNFPLREVSTLRATMHVGEGAGLQQNRRAFQFEVLGLPEGNQALLMNIRGWTYLRIVDGKSREWSRVPFESAEEAHHALIGEIEAEKS